MNWPVALVCTIATAAAQEPQFHTRAHEVVVPVSVTTKSGKPVEGLEAVDFAVLSDGSPQRIRMVERDAGALPIYAVMVIQRNGSSEAALAKIKKTASIVSNYIANDMGNGAPSLAAVISASDDVRTEQDFTADPDLLRDVFQKMSAEGDAGRLLDGVNLGCDMLIGKKEAARRVVVLISESRDRDSKTRFADVVAKAQRNDISIYALSYSAYTTPFTQKASDVPPRPEQPGIYDPEAHGGGIPLLALPVELARLGKVNVAEALPRATGGGHEKFTTLRGLEMQLSEIGTEIHNRYVLTFVPPEAQAAGYHTLSVTLTRPGEFRVHARAGYWTGFE